MFDKMVSLDTSSKDTGCAVFINGQVQEYGHLNCETIRDSNERMNKMCSEIQKELNRIMPTTVVVETTSVTRNANTQRMLTMILGVVYGWCLEHNADYVSYRPTQWRKLITKGEKPKKREELKKWSLRMCKDLYDLDLVNDNISDAILIGRAHLNQKVGGQILEENIHEN